MSTCILSLGRAPLGQPLSHIHNELGLGGRSGCRMQDAGCRVLHHSRSGRCHACLPLMCLSIMSAGPACPNASPECQRVPSPPHLIISPLMKAQVTSTHPPIVGHRPFPLRLDPVNFPHRYLLQSIFALVSSPPPQLSASLLPPHGRDSYNFYSAVPSCSAASSLHLLAAAPSSFPSLPTPLPCACSYCSASSLRFRAAFIASLALLLRPNCPTHLS